jgi:hypothetical protein
LLVSKQGKVRLAKWYQTLSPRDRSKIIKDVTQLVLARKPKMCNILEYKGKLNEGDTLMQVFYAILFH